MIYAAAEQLLAVYVWHVRVYIYITCVYIYNIYTHKCIQMYILHISSKITRKIRVQLQGATKQHPHASTQNSLLSTFPLEMLGISTAKRWLDFYQRGSFFHLKAVSALFFRLIGPSTKLWVQETHGVHDWRFWVFCYAASLSGRG